MCASSVECASVQLSLESSVLASLCYYSGLSFPSPYVQMLTKMSSQAQDLEYIRLDVIIHSFIMEIYIAPLQGYYLEVLPTLAWLQRTVFMLKIECVRKKPGEQSLCQRKSTQRGQPLRMHGMPGL